MNILQGQCLQLLRAASVTTVYGNTARKDGRDVDEQGSRDQISMAIKKVWPP